MENNLVAKNNEKQEKTTVSAGVSNIAFFSETAVLEAEIKVLVLLDLTFSK